MTIRRATADDRPDHHFPWLRPDGWRPDGHSFVQVDGDRVVGAAMRCPNRVHPVRDNAWASLPPDGSPQLLEALRDVGGRPLTIKAEPGTVEHSALTGLGAERIQHCPPQLVPTGTEELRAWCDESSSLPVETGSTWSVEDLTTTWTQLYEVVHADWSPTVEAPALLTELGPMVRDELATDRTVLVRVGEELVAACFVFETAGEPELEAVAEALLPRHPQARLAVAACLATVLQQADGAPVAFDGHLSDPHFYPLLQTIPGVLAGAGRPLDLFRLTSR